MDFDMTQVVPQYDTEGEDEKNIKNEPVAHIEVLNQPSLKKKLFPILKGDNTIGRQDLCQVSIPVRSLSKKHACIEVRGRSHFIYDMGSRNRTRRGTHYLTPEVRYELRNNDIVVFADVSCSYLVEDVARASDSGSETDPMADAETVFQTVALKTLEPHVNNASEIAVASDQQSCDSAASSDIIMPTQDFTVSKIKSGSQIQSEAIQTMESPPVVKKTNKEANKILVIDSDSDNDQEIEVTSDTLAFHNNNGNHDDSLDLELLDAPTQAYVADTDEDDDNSSEILDLVQDYETTDKHNDSKVIADNHQDRSALFVADTQADDEDSPKPLTTDTEDEKIGLAFRFKTVRTYSKKSARNKSEPPVEIPKPTESIDLSNKEDAEKTVEGEDEDEEEATQDPNLFAMATLAADENVVVLNIPSDTDDKPSDNKDNLPIGSEAATLSSANHVVEDATVPVPNDTIPSDHMTNGTTAATAATVVVSDTIPVESDNASTVPVSKDDTATVPVNEDEAATVVVGEEDLATVEVTILEESDETVPVVAMEVDVKDTETIEIDDLQKPSKPSKDVKKTAEKSNDLQSGSHVELCKTSTPSKPTTSPSIAGSTEKPITDIGNMDETMLKLITPVKGVAGGVSLDESNGVLDINITEPVPETPFAKGVSPKMNENKDDDDDDDDDDDLDSTQPCMDDCSSPASKDKAKRTLPFAKDKPEESDRQAEDATQPYVLEDNEKSNENKKATKGNGTADLKRGDVHEISDDGEDSVEVSQKEDSAKLSYQNAETLPLQAEDENETEGNKSESVRSETVVSAVGSRGRGRKLAATKVVKGKIQKPSSKTEEKIQEDEPSKMEESSEATVTAPNEPVAAMETSEPNKVVPSEEATSVGKMLLGRRKQGRRSSKDSEESIDEDLTARRSSRGRKEDNAAVEKTERRGRKRKTAGEKEIAKDEKDTLGESSKSESPAVTNKDEAVGTKRSRRSVHFVGVSSSEENSQEVTETSRSQEENQENGVETGKKRRGRPSKKQDSVQKSAIGNTDLPDPEENSKKRKPTRGRKSIAEDDKQMGNSETTEKTKADDELKETPAIVDEPQNKKTRSSTVLEDCSEKSNKKSSKNAKAHGKKTEANENQKEAELEASRNADKTEEITDKKSSSDEVPKGESISEVSSEPATTSSPVEESIPKLENEDEMIENTTKKGEDKAGEDSGKGKSKLNTDMEMKEPSKKGRSRATRTSKPEDEEDVKEVSIKTDSKAKLTDVKSNKRGSVAGKSKTDSNAALPENGEKVPEDNTAVEPTRGRGRGRPKKGIQNDSEEPEIVPDEQQSSKKASRSSRKSLQELKPPEVGVKGKKDRESQEEAKKDSEQTDDKSKVSEPKRGRQKSKSSKNQLSVDEADSAEKCDDDNDDFVAPVSRGRSSDKRTVSQRNASSSLQRNTDVSSESLSDVGIPKPEAKTPTGRKRNQSSQSSDQSSPIPTTPRRQQLNSSFSPGTPSSRSLSNSNKPKVMFTGVTDDKLQKIVTDLGGSVVTSFDRCTHLVTDKIRRTVKFLCCLARGIPIVSPSWLTNCKTAKMFIDHNSHIVADSATEKQYKFSLKNSLQLAKDGSLLENYKIHVTKSVKPNVDQMKEIMGSCKAQYLKKMPLKAEENTVVISCDEDRTLCQAALDTGIPIVNAEFILTGILQCDISITKYQIFSSCTPGNKRKPTETDKTDSTTSKRRKR